MASDKETIAPAAFRRTFEVRWADVDANGHLRNTAYSEYATEVRLAFMAQHGFGWHRFEELGFGPVLLEERLEYRREALLAEKVTVDFVALGMSPDAARWRVRHRVFKEDGRLAATVTIHGGFLDLAKRKLMAPPEAAAAAFRTLERSDDFEDLKVLHHRG